MYIALSLIIVIGLIAFLCWFTYQTSTKPNSLAEEQKAITESVLAQINQIDFQPTRILYLSDKYTFKKPIMYKKLIAFNFERQELAFADYKEKNLHVVKFSDIINYEIYKNGSLSSVALDYGFALGGSSERVVKELKLIIRLRNIDQLQIIYDIISCETVFGLGKTSKAYRECYSTLHEAVALLEFIIDSNKTTTE